MHDDIKKLINIFEAVAPLVGFSAGETLQLIISGSEIIPSPPYKKDASFNHGKHVLHFGGEYDSYLLVPKIPPKAE